MCQLRSALKLTLPVAANLSSEVAPSEQYVEETISCSSLVHSIALDLADVTCLGGNILSDLRKSL